MLVLLTLWHSTTVRLRFCIQKCIGTTPKTKTFLTQAGTLAAASGVSFKFLTHNNLSIFNEISSRFCFRKTLAIT